MLGWYDEFSGTIPWYLTINELDNVKSFLHNYIGGVSAAEAYLEGTEKWSLIRYFLSHYDLWIGNFLIRFLGFTFSIFGVYICAKEIFNCSRYLSISIGLSSIFINFIPYGWMLASVGWCPGIIAWLLYIYFGNFKSSYFKYGLLFIISLIAALTTPPVFLVPFSGFTILIFCFLFKRKIKINFLDFMNTCLFGIIFLIPQILNWKDGIFSSVIKTKDFSSRMLKILSEDQYNHWLDLVLNLTKQNLYEYCLFILRDPHPLLIVLFLLVLILSIMKDRIKEAALLFLLTFLAPILLQIFSKILNVPILSQYSWNTLWEMQPLIFSLYIGFLSYKPWSKSVDTFFLKNEILNNLIYYFKNKSLQFISLILLFTSLLAIYKLTNVTLQNLNAFGGAGITDCYKDLEKLNTYKSLYRVISTGNFCASIPTYYNLDTFDGLLHISHARRNLFVAYALHNPPKEKLNTGWHVFYDLPKNINLSMFLLANVKYLLSDHVIKENNLELISFTPEIFANDIQYFGKDLFKKFFKNIKLTPSLYIYKIFETPWPRVGVAKKFYLSKNSYKSKDFYKELINLPKDSILIAQDDHIKELDAWRESSVLKIISYSLTKNGINVITSGQQGIIYVNQLYSPFWEASCQDKKLKLVAANGILMATYVPKDCRKIEFKYLN